jgi:hypothetical protein
MVVYVAMEIIRAMKPWASADENTARKPFRPVVAVGSTAIRRGVIVAVRAVGGGSNADSDADLRPCFGSGRCEAKPSNNNERKIFQTDHMFSLLSRGRLQRSKPLLKISTDGWCPPYRISCITNLNSLVEFETNQRVSREVVEKELSERPKT